MLLAPTVLTVTGDVSVGNDLLLTSVGGVINFNGGDVTITHATDTLTFAGVAGNGYVFNDGNIIVGNGVIALAGFRVGADAAANEIDDATQGGASTALFIGNAQITVSSDMRLKTGIRDTKVNALGLIDQMRIVDFEWNDPADQIEYGKNYRGTYTGMLAQDLVKLAPWTINDQGGGRDCPKCSVGKECTKHIPWHVEYDHLVPTLVKAIQELNAEISALKRVA